MEGITPSNSLLAGFIIFPILLACWWIWVTGRAYTINSDHASLNPVNSNSTVSSFNFKAAGWAAVLMVGWLASAAFVSHQDWAHTFDSFPPPGVRAFLLFIVITILISLSSVGKTLALQTPIWLLIGFQAFRIPLELLIHQAYLENITIIEMTYFGRNFDIVTGILALAIAFYAFKKEVSSRIILMWNILGFALLINVVATGVMSMPHRFQMIETDMPNTWVVFFPFVWLPFVLVASALFGHILVLRHLLARRRDN